MRKRLMRYNALCNPDLLTFLTRLSTTAAVVGEVQKVRAAKALPNGT